mmetsp:Transcript_8924/g.11833  ORF Transcript_8924/g.11833 Transcript_8924/m.11833 type:complete len:209 (+) Transcript_8924:136-762(+)
MEDIQQRFKVVLLGEGRVGKTSILLRYIKGEYNDKQTSTISASYLDKRVQIGAETVHLSVWDTAGQERFHALAPIYYRDTDGALLVYDVTDEESFAKAQKWVKELRRVVGDGVVIALAGNKIDMQSQRQVTDEQALSYAESVQATHHLTSAKKNIGLGEAFEDLAKRMAKRRKKESRDHVDSRGQGSTARQKLIIVDDEVAERSSYCC